MDGTRSFRDRRHAGAVLGRALIHHAGRDEVLVLGLPRGGVPVAFEIATLLDAPLDVLIVRKLGVPGHEELAMGAIASGGIRVLDPEIIRAARVSKDALEVVIERETEELARRERAFRGARPPLDVADKTVILVDDGLATGSSMLAAISALRTRSPAKIIAAVPVAPPETCRALRARVDEMICVLTPPQLHAVGVWYADFSQTTDAEVRLLLEQAERQRSRGAARRDTTSRPADMR
jgi:predicted phosphoribosyltransferase